MKRFGIFVILCVLTFSCQSRSGYSKAPVEGDFVVIDTDSLKDSKPEFFSIKFGRKTVSFFVLKIGDRIESYLDACMKCYPHKKGFRVDGFYLVCRWCNERYPLDQLKRGFGSCYPIPLKGYLKGNLYKIKLNVLKKAAKFF